MKKKPKKKKKRNKMVSMHVCTLCTCVIWRDSSGRVCVYIYTHVNTLTTKNMFPVKLWKTAGSDHFWTFNRATLHYNYNCINNNYSHNYNCYSYNYHKYTTLHLHKTTLHFAALHYTTHYAYYTTIPPHHTVWRFSSKTWFSLKMEHPTFQYFIDFIIIPSSILLFVAMENHNF